MDNTGVNGSVTPEFKPGDTITPNSTPADTAAAPVSLPQPSSPLVQPQVTVDGPAPSPAVASQPQPETSPAPVFEDVDIVSQAELQPAQFPAPVVDDETVSWTASEFIAHNKSGSWYLMLSGAVIVIAAIVYLITKDKISTAVVLVAGIAFGGYAARKPQMQEYSVSSQGVTIGSKYFAFGEFRSFSVLDEGAISSISFLPLKRFSPLTTIYCQPDIEEAVVDIVADHLPLENRGHDAFDRFMKKIHF